uniref:C2H2-type domain-containing protein n=1 Tax=Anopheles farauti TaxID=69004 RepID=A0A499FUZ1_9DIPT
MDHQLTTSTDGLKVYLTPEEILAEKIYICSFDNCFVMLHNLAHLQMHLTRHHKAPPVDPTSFNNTIHSRGKLFHCPNVGCRYYQTPSTTANGARYFNSLRSLKQHYLKVHGDRKYCCNACQKSFATESYLRHHRLSCGRTFTCDHCSYSYGSREALLTHAKRKKHGYDKLLSTKKLQPAKTTKTPLPRCTSTGTQTLRERTENDQSTQTVVEAKNADELREHILPLSMEPIPVIDSSNAGNVPHTIENIESQVPVVCTETQTDFIDVLFASAENRHDPLLSYAHMYTQTSDEPGLFADLGLSTTETQTSWNEEGEPFGDYLVSTETQTNFDIDGFDCSSSSTSDKINPGNCKQTQIPEVMRSDFHSLGGAEFLEAIGDSIDGHSSVHAQTS